MVSKITEQQQNRSHPCRFKKSELITHKISKQNQNVIAELNISTKVNLFSV